jgi:hypothetical protein
MQVTGVFYNKPVVTDNLELYVDAANINSFDPDDLAYNGAASKKRKHSPSPRRRWWWYSRL